MGSGLLLIGTGGAAAGFYGRVRSLAVLSVNPRGRQPLPGQSSAPALGKASRDGQFISPAPAPSIGMHSQAETKAHRRILPCLRTSRRWSGVCLISRMQSPRIEGMVIKKPREQCLTLSKCFLVVIPRSKENPEENTR